MIDLQSMIQRVRYDILKGYNYRPLLRPSKGMDRVSFLAKCWRIIDDAERMGGESPEERARARDAAIRAIAEQSLFFFCVFVLKMDYVNHDYGYRLCYDVQYNKWNGKLWIIARDHFKTTIITQASTLWELMKDPERTYRIVSYKIEFAINCVSNIKDWCENCPLLHELWPSVFWEDPASGHCVEDDGTERNWTWTKKSIELRRKRTSKEKSVDAGSINGAGGTGFHYTHLIYDDAETPETVLTPESIDQAYNDIVMTFNTGVTSDLNYAFIGTFYAKDDVYVRLIKNGQVKESIIQPCVEKDGSPICYTSEQLEVKIASLNSTDAALTQMFCDPSLSNNTTLDPSWIRRWEPDSRMLNVYIVVDPAGNKQKRTNDYTAMWVVGLDFLGNMKVLDMVRDRLNSTSKFTTLLSLVQSYRPIRTFYEQESMQADIDLMTRMMQQYNAHFVLVPFSMKKHGSKFERMDQLRTPLENGNIWFPYRCSHVNYQGKSEDMLESFIRDEYLGYPLVSHDDAMDALASAWILFMTKSMVAPLATREAMLGAAGSRMIAYDNGEDDEGIYDCYDAMS